MFTESRAVFLYCVSPVHMGAGTAVGGLIDNPIQRERHTRHPVFAGSGIKGALRHRFQAENMEEIEVIFGPDKSASEHAGAVSFSDAQLVAFPLRSLKNGFVYATCPTALARAKRQLELSGVGVQWEVPQVAEEQALICNTDLLSGDALSLEAFQFLPKLNEEVKGVADWLAGNALPAGAQHNFFREKIANDLVVLSDTDFGYFVENATSVEPHVRINQESGTAYPGGLFYTENLPPESLLLTSLMASDGRKKGSALKATDVVEKVLSGINGQLVQIGGDATTGRGQIIPCVVSTESGGA